MAIGMDDRDWLASRLSRRAFVGLLGKGTGVFVLGGLIRFLEPKQKFIRPPGALPEEEFLALCTRCLKCVEMCPNIIDSVSLAESVISVGTPRMRFSCSRCMRCNYVCPTGALAQRR